MGRDQLERELERLANQLETMPASRIDEDVIDRVHETCRADSGAHARHGSARYGRSPAGRSLGARRATHRCGSRLPGNNNIGDG